MSGGTAPNGNTSNLPLFGTPEQQIADPFGLFPGTPPKAGGPASLPNFGINPLMPKGAFNARPQPVGGGSYNAMAAQSAGPLFNPSLNQHPGNMQAVQMPATPQGNVTTGGGSKGSSGLSSMQPPGIGGGNGNTIGRFLTGGL